jgi:hypothetical protein
MNRKSLKKLWIVGWILFVLSYALIPIVYFGLGETITKQRQLSATMSWVCGLVPVLIISCMSLVLTLVHWKNLDPKARTYGLLCPGLVVLILVISMKMIGPSLGW